MKKLILLVATGILLLSNTGVEKQKNLAQLVGPHP